MRHELTTPDAWAAPLGDFLGWLRASNRPETTIYLRSYQLRRFALDVGRAPFEVTTAEMVEYLNRREWSPNTRRGASNALRAFYRWALLAGAIDRDPAALLPVAPGQMGLPRPAAKSDIEFGLTSPDPRVRLMIRLGYQMGLRCTEICQVHSRDLVRDLVGYSLHVHGKGRRDRLMAVPPEIVAGLLALEAGYAFPGRVDGHLSAGYVSKLISRELTATTTAHMLRHTFGTNVLEAAGGDIRVAQEALGHANITSTQVYTKVRNAKLRDAILLAAAA
jgi:site-specific recombinase XerD